MKTLTKQYRLVWDDEIILYGKYTGETVTKHNAFECDTQEELDGKTVKVKFKVTKYIPKIIIEDVIM